MQTVKLNFYGYTWEDFKWQVANLKGILLVYRGKLDHEGFAVMEEILYIGNTSINELYETPLINEIKKGINPTDMLFFSYAEVDENVAIEVESLLVNKVKPRYSKVDGATRELTIECQGNCTLLPSVVISNNHSNKL